MTSELEALKRLLDTASSPAPRDGASGGDVLPGEGAPKPASPLDVDAIMASLRAKNVFADLRRPDVIRVAPAPLYNSFADVHTFVAVLKEALAN